MNKPPKTTPHSDVDGVREDQRAVVKTANDARQGGQELERARKESVGRPKSPNSGN